MIGRGKVEPSVDGTDEDVMNRMSYASGWILVTKLHFSTVVQKFRPQVGWVTFLIPALNPWKSALLFV